MRSLEALDIIHAASIMPALLSNSSLEGAGFKFENPNVKSNCGCGSSFQE